MKTPRKPTRKVDGRRRYKKQLWGGFCDNVLHMRYYDVLSGDDSPAIFSSKKVALKAYTDVRPIEIRELGPLKRLTR